MDIKEIIHPPYTEDKWRELCLSMYEDASNIREIFDFDTAMIIILIIGIH